MTKDKALKLALEALEKSDGFLYYWHESASDDEADAYAAARQLNEQAMTAVKEALAEDALQRLSDIHQEMEQQPVRREQRMYMDEEVFYTAPAQQEPEEGNWIEVKARWGKRFVEMPNPLLGGGYIARFNFEPEQEPVAYIGMVNGDHFSDVCRKANGDSNTPLYAAPPQRKPLTGEEMTEGCRSLGVGAYRTLAAAFETGVRFAETAHGIKENT